MPERPHKPIGLPRGETNGTSNGGGIRPLTRRLIDALSGPTSHAAAIQRAYRARRDDTLHSLNEVNTETLVRLSALTLPEIEALKHELASILPAGNLPGLVLSGLTTLKGRRVGHKRVQSDLLSMFQGISLLPQGLYSLLIVGPAAVLAAYQTLLTLAGKDVDSAFPEGPWQFYLQFGLREDTARHTNETLAYFRSRPSYATTVDDVAAWLMTAIYTLFDSHALTGALWTEWTTLRLLRQAAQQLHPSDESPFDALLRNWQAARPYRTPPRGSYADQRRADFDAFTKSYLALLPEEYVQAIRHELHGLAESDRSAYQTQMSLLACLEPDRFQDHRVPLQLWEACVGLVWQGRYYLFDVCARDVGGRPVVFTKQGDRWPLHFRDEVPVAPDGRTLVMSGGWLHLAETGEPIGYLSPPDLSQLKGLVEALLYDGSPSADAQADLHLVRAPRSDQTRLRELLPAETRSALRALTCAPIIINWDEHPTDLPLGELRRQARRGIGDHPLTVIRTAKSIVFDQSHVFFDGAWGMAVAEVMTNQAVTWCQLMTTVRPHPMPIPQSLALRSTPEFEQAAQAAHNPELFAEADAETDAVDFGALRKLRAWLLQRGASLTVNDLLLLARFFHAADYQPSQALQEAIATLDEDVQIVVEGSLRASSGVNPALLIPMDASFVCPRERVFPTTFRNPLTGLLDVYSQALAAFEAYCAVPGDETWAAFDECRRVLLSYLRTFGEVLKATKAIAMRGESFGTATIKMLAHLPPAMQHLLNKIPQRVGVLNEVVKGEEVFSNVGQVAEGASLSRFLSAKDDGRAKTLVWGVLTDNTGRMVITLRDFRPHVPIVPVELGHALVRDYLESYAAMLNWLVATLSDIVLAER